MMRSAITAIALLASAAYAAPQNGRWSPDWQGSKANSSSAPPAQSTSSSHPSSAPPPSSTSTSTTTPLLLGNPNATPNPPPNDALSASLLTSSSASTRMQTLFNAASANTTSFKFDFSPAANPNITPGQGGEVILANRATFPALTGLGTAFAALFFAPCGLNTPHIHPRATEVFTLVTDGSVSAGFVFDNTFTMEVAENLTQFQGMAFPQGAIHWQLNNECTPQVGIAGFSDEDPGASSIAQNFIVNTNPDIVLASLGFPSQITAENFREVKERIPAPFVLGIQECYKRCGIEH